MDIAGYILLIPALLLSLSFHEYMHGRASYILGDPTPKIMGRLTMNPLAHLDVVGTLVLLITRVMGWAKPVPINPRYYKNPRKGMMIVGLAGPMANIFLASFFAIILRIYSSQTGVIIENLSIYSRGPVSDITILITNFLMLTIMVNLGLACFNLLPIPPLDGSKILRGFLPSSFDYYLNKLEGPAGMLFIFALIFLGVIEKILWPVINTFLNILV
ncbi:MAG: site-2 protease family protein [Bacillota bacterium]